MVKKFELTEQQTETLKELRCLFGENDYEVCDVAPFFRRHEQDFLAVHNEWKRKFVVVRPTRGGGISIVGFCLPSLYVKMRKIINDARGRLPVRIVWSGKQLRFAEARPDWWKQYFTPEVANKLGS